MYLVNDLFTSVENGGKVFFTEKKINVLDSFVSNLGQKSIFAVVVLLW